MPARGRECYDGLLDRRGGADVCFTNAAPDCATAPRPLQPPAHQHSTRVSHRLRDPKRYRLHGRVGRASFSVVPCSEEVLCRNVRGLLECPILVLWLMASGRPPLPAPSLALVAHVNPDVCYSAKLLQQLTCGASCLPLSLAGILC